MTASLTLDQALALAQVAKQEGALERLDDLVTALQKFAAEQLGQNRPMDARPLLIALCELWPTNPLTLRMLALCALQTGRAAEAEILLRQSLSLDRSAVDGWSHLGVALIMLDRGDEAVAVLTRALEMDPNAQHVHNTLGMLRIQRGQFELALRHFEAFLAVDPTNVDVRFNLGLCQAQRGNVAVAEAIFRDVLSEWNDHVEALVGLAELCSESGREQEALALLRRARTLKPQSTAAINNLGTVLLAEGHLAEAHDVFQGLIRSFPDHSIFWNNNGNVLKAMARLDGAIQSYRRALHLDPNRSSAQQNIIATLAIAPTASIQDLGAETAQWQKSFASGLPRCSHGNTRDPSKRLRIGYVSADFRRHAAAYFLEPLIAAHDPSGFDVYCYQNRRSGDEVTARMQGLPVHWRQVAALDDTELIEQIQADGIDILVDCGGHSAENRLLAFAHKPSPIQVTTLLGHGASTGLKEIDYIIADLQIVPPGSESEYSEKVLRLPFFAPFRPNPDWPQPMPMPDGSPVFGCVGDPARIGSETIAAWAVLLERQPDARLILKHGSYKDPDLAAHWRRHFAPLGDRVAWEGIDGGWDKHMDFYGRITAVLDTAPACGGSSSLIPLWMGVPVLSVEGDRAVGRFGASILRALGLGQLLAADPLQQIEKAVALVSDRSGLAALRRDLRERMASSVICDGHAVIAVLEAEYRRIWNDWCVGEGAGR